MTDTRTLSGLSDKELSDLRDDYAGMKCGEDVVAACDELIKRRKLACSEISVTNSDIARAIECIRLLDENDACGHAGSVEFTDLKKIILGLASAPAANDLLAIAYDVYKENYGNHAEAIPPVSWHGIKAAVNTVCAHISPPKREYSEVTDIDAEILLAEGIQTIPVKYTYEEFGTPVLKYLKSMGYKIIRIEDQGSKP